MNYLLIIKNALLIQILDLRYDNKYNLLINKSILTIQN